jgi:hypothetical protein
VNHDLRFSPQHRLHDRGPVESVGDDRLCSDLAQPGLLGARTRHAHDLVATRDKQRNEALPDDTSGAGYENLHCTSPFVRAVPKDEVPTLTTATFLYQLVPNERVVEVDEFETTDPTMRGEMTITVTLSDTDEASPT